MSDTKLTEMKVDWSLFVQKPEDYYSSPNPFKYIKKVNSDINRSVSYIESDCTSAYGYFIFIHTLNLRHLAFGASVYLASGPALRALAESEEEN